MKCLSILGFLAVSALGQSSMPKSVYVMAMGGGLDQHLAGWLTREHVMQVVADPKLADAVLTDSLGDTFEQRLALLQPEPTEAKKDGENTVAASRPAFHSAAARGTIFLVDVKTKRVLWSAYEKAPSDKSAASLDREAGHIAKKLQLTFGK